MICAPKLEYALYFFFPCYRQDLLQLESGRIVKRQEDNSCQDVVFSKFRIPHATT